MDQIVQGIDIFEATGLDDAHENIAGFGAIQGLVEVGILSIHDGNFLTPLQDVVVKWRACDPEEKGQFMPVFGHIINRFAKTAVGLNVLLIKLSIIGSL